MIANRAKVAISILPGLLLAFAIAAAPWLTADRSLPLAAATAIWPIVSVSILVLTIGSRRAMQQILLLLVFCVVGALAAAGVTAGLVHWTNARFGRFDPEFVGLSIFLPVLYLSGIILFAGALVTRSVDRLLSVMATATIVVALALSILSLPGALDGVSAEGLPLAAGVIASTVIAIAEIGAIVVLLRSARTHGGQS